MISIFKKEEKTTREPEAFIFIGRSGAGKGTQAELLKEYLKKCDCTILHIETGALLRELIKGQSYTEGLIRKTVNEGGLVPEPVAVNMWFSYLKETFTGKEDLLFDGSPRKIMEARLLDGMLTFYGFKHYKVIYLDVPTHESTKRLTTRGRKDDTTSGIENRMKWFESEVLPCVEFFKTCDNAQLLDINGHQSIEAVHAEIVSKIGL